MDTKWSIFDEKKINFTFRLSYSNEVVLSTYINNISTLKALRAFMYDDGNVDFLFVKNTPFTIYYP